MKKCFNLGALALLGALTFKLILWPIFCCAVSAAPVFRTLALTSHSTENENQQLESASMEFNDKSLINQRQTSSIYDIFLETVQNDSSAKKQSPKNKSKRVKEMRSKKLSTLERNERSANLSHISGSARKIQLYIKNRFLQLLPDGAVNGTSDHQSDYCKFSLYFPKFKKKRLKLIKMTRRNFFDRRLSTGVSSSLISI